MTDRHNDWVAVDYTREVLGDVRKRLQVGGEGQGAMLTADECMKVLACLVDPPFPNSRPPEHGVERIAIATHCARLVKGGETLKGAVEKTAAHFQCSRSTVYAARRDRNRDLVRRVLRPNKSRTSLNRKVLIPGVLLTIGEAVSLLEQLVSDTDKIIPRPRASLAEIELPDGDTLISREVFAREVLGVCTRTATRMNLPTTHVGGIAYVKKNAALKIVGDAATRRNQPPKRRRV